MPKVGWESRRVRLTCQMCAAEFSVKPSRLSGQRSPVKFCSKSCADASMVKVHDGKCSGCGATKPLSEFYADRHKKRGRVAKCKDCYRVISKTVLSFKPYRREGSYSAGAKRRGLEYALTKEQFMSFWGKPCAYCGDEIATVGLDRIRNEEGYTMDNVVSCCTECNSMKSSMTAAEFLERCRRIAAMDCNSAITFGGRY